MDQGRIVKKVFECKPMGIRRRGRLNWVVEWDLRGLRFRAGDRGSLWEEWASVVRVVKALRGL
jgi:hypothetical protein